MYLKKVEICGFKSFAEKTVLDFKPGISGIIGPNGCGKSNISDSIRWCLGEQRAKSMRGSNMQEIIFGGTQTRSTTGMAEVSLTFDNSQNVLPINYSEVVITRRLFRSGESEYFINKAQCRLKDIRDIFLDTGIGADGYSIIEQGKVDSLTMAKPEDRRELFEEVAGVAKYKVRREETLRKLEKLDADMSRISDALSIHKQQITALDVAAKKAKQYQQYQEELAKYEVASLVQHISYGNNEIERLKNELDPKIVKFETTNTSMRQLEAQIQEIRINLDEKNEQYVSLNGESSELKMQIGVCDQIIQHSSNREVEITEDKKRVTKELILSKDKILQMQQQLQNLNSNDTHLTFEVDALEKEYKQKEENYNSIKLKLSKFEQKENEIRNRLSTVDLEKAVQLNLKAELSESKIHLDADISSLQRIASRLETEIEPTTNEIVAIEAELDSSRELIESFDKKQDELNKSIIETEEKIKALDNILISYKEELASNQSRIATLKEFDQQDPVRSSIRSVLNLGLARGPVSSLINCDADKAEIIASALGEKLNYLICETSQTAEKAIAFLEENDLSRLSFIVADKVSNFYQQSVVSLSYGYTELIKYLKYDLQDENIIRFICSDILISANKVYGKVVVQGGGKTSFEKPVLIEEQVKTLQLKSEQLSQSILSSKTGYDHLKECQMNLKLEKERLGFECIKIKTQIEGKQHQIEEKRNNIETTSNEISKNKEEIDAKTLKLFLLSDKISGFEIKLTDFIEEEWKLHEELKVTQDNIFCAKKEEELSAPLMMEARSDWDKKTSEFENKQKGQQYLKDNIETIERQITSCENIIVENDRKLKELVSSIEKESTKIQVLYKDKTNKEIQIQVSLTEKQTLQTVLDDHIQKVHVLRSKADELSAAVNSIHVELKNFEFQKNDLEQRLLEVYNKNYDEIKNDFNDIDINNDAISRIKKKIDTLGAVNLAAQEEYDALEERYNFLSDQQQDLQKSEEDLKEVIKKTNQSTIENFKKTFDIVRENFKNLYKKLFGGGEADLMLTDENNLLETGIDIYAQPAGKKLQNISLCSGGEKALTAVALLFAFFIAKPSPFCILDEVDASLDDANVGRYTAVVKEFSSKTQFLVVTHNKRTMRMVDVLYGVTMEEQGVSKIISVKMSHQDDKAIKTV